MMSNDPMYNIRPCKVVLSPLTVDMCYDIGPSKVVLPPIEINKQSLQNSWTISRGSTHVEVNLQQKVRESFRAGVDSSKRTPRCLLVKKPYTSNLPCRKSRRLTDTPLCLSKEAVLQRALERGQRKQKTKKEEGEQSDYEKMIQMNRKKRLTFLKSLNIEEVKKSFRAGVNSLKRKQRLLVKYSWKRKQRLLVKDSWKQKERLLVKKPYTSNLPCRKSIRLANTPLCLSEEAILRRALKRGRREQESEKERLPKTFEFREVWKSKQTVWNFTNDYSSITHADPKRMNEFPLKFESMKTNESQIVKFPPNLTCIAIHPACDKIIISAASMSGRISFWNMNSSNPYVFLPHSRGVTNLKFNPYDSNQIVSSSNDGGLRCGDMEKHVFDEVYSDDESRIPCTYFDVLSKSTFIVAHRNGIINVVDIREASRKAINEYSRLDSCVRSLCVHPQKKNYFISSEIKGSIKLWDLRTKSQTVVSMRHGPEEIWSAFFSPVTGNSILSTSPLCLRVLDSSNLIKDIPCKKYIPNNNTSKSQRLKAIWAPNSDDTFVGSRQRPSKIVVFEDNGNKKYTLLKDDLRFPTNAFAFHPSLAVLAGGHLNGKVNVFTY